MHSWSDAALRWQRENRLRTAETIRREDRLISFASERIGRLHIDDIRGSTLLELRSAADALGWGPRSCNYLIQTVRTVLRSCKAWDWTRFDPPYIKPLRLPPGRTRWLTPADAERLLAALSDPARSMAAFALETGLRKSNVVGLRWSWIAVDLSSLSIPADQNKTRQILTIPLSARARELIAARRFEQESDLVFHKDGRALLTPNSHAWRRALELCGIENFRWHDLRHTWASWHVQAGTSLKDLKVLGGWRTLAMVDRYSHLSIQHVAAAVDRLDGWRESIERTAASGRYEQR